MNHIVIYGNSAYFGIYEFFPLFSFVPFEAPTEICQDVKAHCELSLLLLSYIPVDRVSLPPFSFTEEKFRERLSG